MASSMQQRIQKRELERPELERPENVEWDTFQAIKEQSNVDLDRSMNNIAEDLEAERLRLEESPDQYMFDVEGVEKERLRGVENMRNLRDTVDRQDFVYRQIMSKVHDEAEVQQNARKEKTRTDSRDNPYRVVPFPLAECDTLRVQSACIVANKLARSRVGHDRQKRRKQGINAQEERFIEALREKHEIDDQRVVQRQQELVQRQVDRALHSQQRRNEQQKMLKEIQRDQDHQFEMLQLKHHPESVSSHKLPSMASSRAQSSSQAPPPASEPTKMSRNASEPIFRDMTQSHKLYASTLERWRTFEADNEKRTDDYWRKMLPGEHSETRRKEAKQAEGLFRSVAKNINVVRTFAKRTAAPMDGLPEPGSYLEGELEAIDTQLSEQSMEFGTGERASISDNRCDSPSRKQYAERRRTVINFQAEQLSQALEKDKRDKAFLEEKILRGKEYQNAKAEKAGEAMKAWEQRSTASAQRRESLAIQNDGESEVKMNAAQQRLDETQVSLEQERGAMAGNRLQRQKTIKAEADRTIDDRIEKYAAKSTNKTDKAVHAAGVRAAHNAHRAREGQEDAVASQKCLQKQKTVDDFQKKTIEGIQAKESQHGEAWKRSSRASAVSMDAAHHDKNPSLQRRRLLREDSQKDRPVKGPPVELTLPADLALPSHLFLSPKSSGTALQECDPASLSPAGKKLGIDSSISGEAVLEQHLEKIAKRKSIGGRSSIGNGKKSLAAQTPSSLLSSGGTGSSAANANLGASAGGSSRRSNDGSDEDSEGECHFLEDLRVQSSKWLQEMRVKT